jgi:hypothetical protein
VAGLEKQRDSVDDAVEQMPLLVDLKQDQDKETTLSFASVVQITAQKMAGDLGCHMLVTGFFVQPSEIAFLTRTEQKIRV